MIHNISRFIAALALLATAQGAWAQSTETLGQYTFTVGTDDEGSYYAVDCEEALIGLSIYIEVDRASGKRFKQTADITMTGAKFNNRYFGPIGNYKDTYFSGTYDGGGHTISGLNVSHSAYAGLFGCVQGANLHDIVLVSPTVATTATNANTYVGPIVAFTVEKSTQVSNCTVINPTVTLPDGFKGNAGAIVGKIYDGRFSNCHFYGGNQNKAIGFNFGNTVTNVTRVYTLTATGCTATATATVTVGTTSYYNSGTAVSLTAADRDGYILGYASDDVTITDGAFTMPAADVAVAATFTPDPAHFSQSGDEYTIHTATGWNVFCDLLADNTKGYFDGKTVNLGADITVTRMAGGSNHAFTGTFDGQGHTLTVNYGTADEPVNQQFVAPFPVVEGAATFRSLTIAGSIYSGYATSGDKGTGGLIGHLFGGVTVEHCVSTVTVNAASDRAGGFVGLCEHAVTFTDCVSSAIATCTGSGSGFVGWSRDSKYTIAFYGCLFDGKVLKQGTVGSGNGSFVGWKGFSKTVTITNCIAAPAADENMATDNSATFCRYSADTSKDNGETHITNCYYTATLGNAQGNARHTVTAGTDVTVAHAGVATHYATSGITAYKASDASGDSDPFIAGIIYNNVLYAGSGDAVSLTLSNTAPGDVPDGYQYGYTASAGTLSGTTLTMPDADVTISVNTAALRSTGQPVTVAYIKAYGTPGEASAIALDGHEAVGEDDFVHLAAGTYYVGTDITYANQIRPTGNITLILADGKTMTLNGNMWGIYGGSNLTIYGQSLDAATAGTLRYNGKSHGISANNYEQHSGNVSITTTGSSVSGINADVTLRGGTLTISADGNDAYAIFGARHSILGGQLTATGTNATGILATAYSGTALTLGWTRLADRITASSISTPNGGTVAVATGQALTDGSGNIYTGTLSASVLSGFAAETTLQPCLALADAADNTAAIAAHAGKTLAVALSGRTLYKDGAWNTLVLPFTIDDIQADGCPLNGATVRQLSKAYVTGTTLTLNFSDPTTTMAAGTPYIVKWPLPDGMTAEQFDAAYAANPDPYELKNPLFRAVTLTTDTHDYDTQPLTDPGSDTYDATLLTDERVRFIGTYDHKTIDTEDRSILFLGAANTLYYPSGKNGGTTIAPFRAYFKIGPDDAHAAARQLTAFNLTFGDGSEAQGIGHTEITEITEKAGAWYTIDGVRLDGKPTKKGLYIHGGRKVVIP